jgi:hypothetical protein
VESHEAPSYVSKAVSGVMGTLSLTSSCAMKMSKEGLPVVLPVRHYPT